jgi:hypothetical protein
MKVTLSAITLGVVLFAPAALAANGPDVKVTIAAPAGVKVYSPGSYTVTVANVGSRRAQGVTVSIALPETDTSPRVYLLGTLGALDSHCRVNETELSCDVANLNPGARAALRFELTLPQSTKPLEIVAVASVAGDVNTDNDSATATVLLDNPNAPVTATESAPLAITNTHCTGTTLTSYFECTLFPSSISGHTAVLAADGNLTFPGQDPSYSGTWIQPSHDPRRLQLTYRESGTVVAEFDGYATSPKCFEGLTRFVPATPQIALYRVCVP